ncbi:MAG: esterase-like activity of phytase family protein [Pirellulales bacterium]|nr:esterase-like activity of phytase family protein [Pirellulales bacterium]
MRRHLLVITSLLLAPSACLFASSSTSAANWQVNRVNHLVLTPPGGVTVDQMSGVTYLGLVGGNHRFVAAEQSLGQLLGFDVAFNASGGITAISDIATIPIASTLDFEGIAYTNAARNSVFLSDENNPGVREFNLSTGAELQAVAIPPVFANRQPNRGFESLARRPDGTVMWTANEQALTVDGSASTPSAGTDVRILKLDVAGNSVAAGQQYAYRVEPIHGTSGTGTPQSGLSDLVSLPDGTVLSLERSVAFLASPSMYLSRIYEIDFDGATDISMGATAGGLIGQSFTRVGKQLLWSGPADGATGQNLEGLTLGPRLANGQWVLVGVVDDASNDLLSNNTLVAFTATAIPSADFDDDGDTDGADFLHWQRGLGQTVGATHSDGDADRDGDVDADDLTQWKADFAAPGEAAAATVPEPSALTLCGLAALAMRLRRKEKAGEGNRTLA